MENLRSYCFVIFLLLSSLVYAQDTLPQDTGRPNRPVTVPLPDPEIDQDTTGTTGAQDTTGTPPADTGQQPADTVAGEEQTDRTPVDRERDVSPTVYYPLPSVADSIPPDTIRAHIRLLKPDSIPPLSHRAADFIREGERRFYAVSETPNWLFYLFLGLALFYGFVRVTSTRESEEIWTGFRNFNIANQLYRDYELHSKFSYFMLTIGFLVVMAVFTGVLSKFFNWSVSLTFFELTGLSFSLLAVLYILRMAVYAILAKIFSFGKVLGLFKFHSDLIFRVMGLILFPLLILATYLPDEWTRYILYLILFIVAMLILLRYWRGLRLANEYIRFYKFHFILYICVLEIAPVIILIKLAKTYLL